MNKNIKNCLSTTKIFNFIIFHKFYINTLVKTNVKITQIIQ